MTDTPPLRPAIHPEDPDDEWVTPANSGRVFRVRYLTGGLLLLAAISGGFWGGVVAEKHHGNGTPATAARANRFAAARGSGAGAFGRPARSSGAATAGLVIDVSGTTLTISDANGNIVRVTLGPATPITRTANVGPSGLQIGDTVVVTGTTAGSGSVTATAVMATAAGTKSGSFGGGTGRSLGGSGFGG